MEIPDEPQGSDEPDGAVIGAFQDEKQNRLKIEVDGGPIDRYQDENRNQFQGDSCDEPDGATISAPQDENKTQLKCKCLSKKDPKVRYSLLESFYGLLFMKERIPQIFVCFVL